MLTKKILEAQVYALKHHAPKEYGEGIPYAVHVILVVSFVLKYLYLLLPEDREIAVIAAWLHDLIEDAGISYNEIKKLFGERVADVVYSVTNELGKDRHEKAVKTYPKTAKLLLGKFVKLTDRLGNVTYSKMTGNNMFKKYKEEQILFKAHLYDIADGLDPMWEELGCLFEDGRGENYTVII